MTEKQTSQFEIPLDMSVEQLAEAMGADQHEVIKNNAVAELVRSVAGSVQHARKTAGLSQQQLAEMVGTSAARISQLESGSVKNAPNLKTIAIIAHYLNLRPKMVFFHNTEQKPDLEKLGKLSRKLARDDRTGRVAARKRRISRRMNTLGLNAD